MGDVNRAPHSELQGINQAEGKFSARNPFVGAGRECRPDFQVPSGRRTGRRSCRRVSETVKQVACSALRMEGSAPSLPWPESPPPAPAPTARTPSTAASTAARPPTDSRYSHPPPRRMPSTRRSDFFTISVSYLAGAAGFGGAGAGYSCAWGATLSMFGVMSASTRRPVQFRAPTRAFWKIGFVQTSSRWPIEV